VAPSLATATLKSAIACSRVGGQGDAAKGLSSLATGRLQNVHYRHLADMAWCAAHVRF